MYDPKVDKERVQEVAKSRSMLESRTLNQEAPPGVEPVPSERLPIVSLAFKRAGYATGTMTIPARGCKLAEHACFDEVYTMVSGAPRSLFVRIGRATWRFSKGGHFRVPTTNEYELRNESDKPITLQFFMVSEPATAT